MWRLRRFLLRLYNALSRDHAERHAREIASHLALLEEDFSAPA